MEKVQFTLKFRRKMFYGSSNMYKINWDPMIQRNPDTS